VPKLEQIQQTLLDFHPERHGRIYALTHKANIIGIFASANTTIKCFICHWIFIRKVVGMGNHMELAFFDVGNLSIDKP
jgi:hypothetical protein